MPLILTFHAQSQISLLHDSICVMRGAADNLSVNQPNPSTEQHAQ